MILNGELVDEASARLSAFDRGLTLGVGLFETIKVENGQAVALDYHWARLKKSADLINLRVPFSHQTLLHHIETLLLHKELKEGGLRLTLTDGVAKRGVIVKEKGPTNFLLSAFDAMAEIESLSATIVSIRRNEQSPLSQIKSISYLDNVLAKQEALSNGFDEAILLNSQGFISDGATTNVYALKENTLFTPPVSDGALPGVMRARLLDKGFEGHQIKVSSLDKAFLLNAEKIYLSNALIGMKPLHQFEHKTFTK